MLWSTLTWMYCTDLTAYRSEWFQCSLLWCNLLLVAMVVPIIDLVCCYGSSLSSRMSELCSLTGIFWMVVFIKQPEGFDDPHIAKRNMSPTMGLWIKANFSELVSSIGGLSQVAWLSHHWRFTLCIPEVSRSHAMLLSLYVVNVWMKHWHS